MAARDLLGLKHAPEPAGSQRAVWDALRDYVKVVGLYDEELLPAELIAAIGAAEDSVWVWSPWVGQRVYDILPALKATSDRGVDVRAVVLPPRDKEGRYEPSSGKMERLAEIARECRANEQKLLVFSFFRDALVLADAILGSDCFVLHGDVRSPERARQLSAFERAPGFAALVAQITVGGQGLNLHSASVIVILEPQDKPSTEWQAAGRAHRIGQTRPVTVYRLIALDTLEERLVQRGHVKADIFNRVAHPSDLAEDIEAHFVGRGVNLDALLEEERQRIRTRKPSRPDEHAEPLR
ncbi:helicase-related protein [Nonomuraea sp. NPDC052129]|uniref:helicase-related protein n=1 Tax=Nonomuraea sp. NPDC052129 TaxID=3154651 RepID=UPI003443441F